jgi:hypothetical protein
MLVPFWGAVQGSDLSMVSSAATVAASVNTMISERITPRILFAFFIVFLLLKNSFLELALV